MLTKTKLNASSFEKIGINVQKYTWKHDEYNNEI